MDISVAGDKDIRELIGQTQRSFTEALRGTIARLQAILSDLEHGGMHKEGSDVATIFHVLLTLESRVTVLNAIAVRMAARPPLKMREMAKAAEDAIAASRSEQPLEYMAAATVVIGLKAAKLLRLRPLSEGRVRYTFTKPPGEAPDAYRAFQKLGQFLGVIAPSAESSRPSQSVPSLPPSACRSTLPLSA